MDKQLATAFVEGLLHWNRLHNKRHMPWKGEKDPYKIWLSEVILQQTRVEQGWAYYEKFVQQYPTIQHLAAAPDDEVFKLWEGLGYYSRCRNLLHTARYVVQELNGVFPKTYEGILALKGVGPYTAAAIASFAYNAPHAVVDGNVYRVLARIFNDDTLIDSTDGKKHFAQRAQSLLPADKAGEYNQALMDFGATLCTPYPHCAACFFNEHCGAYRQQRQLLLPQKSKRPAVRERYLFYLALQHKGQIAIRKRTGADVWQNLYEFWGTELPGPVKGESVQTMVAQLLDLPGDAYDFSGLAVNKMQRLTHQIIHFFVIAIRLKRIVELPGVIWIPVSDLTRYPFPKTLAAVVQQLAAVQEEGGWQKI